jgi:hypothetical protein
MNQFPVRGSADLLSQLFDMAVDDPVADNSLVRVDFLDQLISGKDPDGIAGQHCFYPCYPLYWTEWLIDIIIGAKVQPGKPGLCLRPEFFSKALHSSVTRIHVYFDTGKPFAISTKASRSVTL